MDSLASRRWSLAATLPDRAARVFDGGASLGGQVPGQRGRALVVPVVGDLGGGERVGDRGQAQPACHPLKNPPSTEPTVYGTSSQDWIQAREVIDPSMNPNTASGGNRRRSRRASSWGVPCPPGRPCRPLRSRRSPSLDSEPSGTPSAIQVVVHRGFAQDRLERAPGHRRDFERHPLAVDAHVALGPAQHLDIALRALPVAEGLGRGHQDSGTRRRGAHS